MILKSNVKNLRIYGGKQMFNNIINFVKRNNRKRLKIMKERHQIYGDNFKQFGKITQALFPDGVELKTESDWNRFGIFVQMVAKLSRYANNFNQGGHEDSLDDLGNYAMILQFLDKDFKQGINKDLDDFKKNCIPECEKLKKNIQIILLMM